MSETPRRVSASLSETEPVTMSIQNPRGTAARQVRPAVRRLRLTVLIFNVVAAILIIGIIVMVIVRNGGSTGELPFGLDPFLALALLGTGIFCAAVALVCGFIARAMAIHDRHARRFDQIAADTSLPEGISHTPMPEDPKRSPSQFEE